MHYVNASSRQIYRVKLPAYWAKFEPAIKMRNTVRGIKLNLALADLDALPAMPEIAQRLLALPLDSEVGERQMLCLIEQDPQISAKLIGLANSPIIGVGHKVNSVHEAAMLLGMKRLKSVAIGIATLSGLTKQPATKYFDPQDLWSHSMAVAVAMNTISRAMPKRMQPDENQVFLAGLLHDIGLMALHHLDPEVSNEFHHQLRLQPRCSMNELELELLGISHAHLGAMLVRLWNLPGDIVEVVERHHSLCIDDAGNANPLVRLANIAEKLLPDFCISEHTGGGVSESEWQELCIAPSCAGDISASICELAIQIVQLPDTHGVSKHTDKSVAPSTSLKSQPASKDALSIIPAPLKVISEWILKKLTSLQK